MPAPPTDAYPDAVAAVVVIESAIEGTTALAGVAFGPDEREALRAALDRMLFKSRVRLPDGLHCLRELLRDDSDDR